MSRSGSLRLGEIIRQWVLGVCLVLPVLVFVALTVLLPPQYTFVVENALGRVWPLVFAVMALLVCLSSSLALISLFGQANRTLVLIALAQPLSFLASLLGAMGANLWFISTLAATLALPLLWFVPNKSKRFARHTPLPLPTLLVVAGFSPALYLTIGAATAIEPVELPRALGALFVLVVALGMMTWTLCLLAMKARLATIAACYALVAILFFSPNHHVVAAATSSSEPIDLVDAFSEWLSSRQDLPTYRDHGKPYPVLLVSSEGGGIYAAAHAYGTLSAFQRNCPTFSQHVFATVGVSGGAIGNLLFAAAQRGRQISHQPCRSRSSPIAAGPVTADHLSPVLTRMLTLEPVDRLTPGQLLARDRAEILAESFLRSAADKPYVSRTMTESFDVHGGRPAVISVATNVANGKRMVLAPVHPLEWAQMADWWPSGAGMGEKKPSDGQEISLIHAAVLSARFPWITPSGRLRVSKDEEVIAADGGYFDNSGSDTVFDILNALRTDKAWQRHHERLGGDGLISSANRCDRPVPMLVENFHEPVEWDNCRIPFFVIHFALASREPAGQLLSPKLARQSFLADPLNALLATRRVRAEVALKRMDIELCGGSIGGAECHLRPGGSRGMFRNDIAPDAWGLPLGWFMSQASFTRIVDETAPPHLFGYASHRQYFQTDTELLIYHFDPALYEAGADPSIGALIEGP